MGVGEPETVDDYYLLIDAFLQGAKMWTFLPNVIDCSLYSHIFLNERNYTQTYLETVDVSNETYKVVRNISSLISNQFAESYLFCHLTVVDGYVFYQAEEEEYPNWLEWLQAFLQNMVGNIININNMMNRIFIA
tara:strand:- start:673 stop:1074 length:402 start_codon:yes stop_codon:yes gene_type:complete